jgi:hypothetical protein
MAEHKGCSGTTLCLMLSRSENNAATPLIHLAHLDKNTPGYIARRLSVAGSIESFPNEGESQSRYAMFEAVPAGGTS